MAAFFVVSNGIIRALPCAGANFSEIAISELLASYPNIPNTSRRVTFSNNEAGYEFRTIYFDAVRASKAVNDGY